MGRVKSFTQRGVRSSNALEWRQDTTQYRVKSSESPDWLETDLPGFKPNQLCVLLPRTEFNPTRCLRKKIENKKNTQAPLLPPAPLKIRNPTHNCRMCFRCLVIFLSGSLLSVRWWTRISNRAASITEPSQQQQPNNNHIVSRRVCLFLRTVLKVVQGPHMRPQQPLMRTQTQTGPPARYIQTVPYLRLSV